MTVRAAGWRRLSGCLASAAVLAIVIGSAGASGVAAPVADPASWTVYHHDATGSGVAEPLAAVATTRPAWTSPALDGQLYGEPLVSGGQVFVATENDTVYALSASTGAVVWSTHLGSPVPAASLPCGNIQPTVGITGTPVLDPSRGEVFVVADELVKGKSAHLLVGLDTASGRTELSQNVDPPGAITSALLQRTGLALDAGQVLFGFGGNYGDCSTYKGWVMAVNEAGGTAAAFAVDAGSGEHEGAIWMGGAAPVVDSAGNVWVSAGNGSVTSTDHPYDNSDSVLELTPSLKLLQFFAPTSWASDNANDLDLSMAPALLSNGQVVVAGKSGIAYLLNGTRLGGIGGQLAARGPICNDDIDGGSAVVGTTVYLPCLGGIVAVRVQASPAGLRQLWSSGTGGGPPVVAAGLVWTIGQDGKLYGLDPGTGTVRQQTSIGAPANHFPTPSVGDGLLVAPTQNRLVAFAATAPGTSTTSPTATSTTTTAARSHPAHSSGSAAGGLPAAAMAGIVAAGVVVIGAIGWLLLRRRARE
jgi:outer membrane protein assembly factor BamB